MWLERKDPHFEEGAADKRGYNSIWKRDRKVLDIKRNKPKAAKP